MKDWQICEHILWSRKALQCKARSGFFNFSARKAVKMTLWTGPWATYLDES